MPITLKGYIIVPLEELEVVQSYLVEHIRNTLNEEGCLEFIVEQDESDKCVFHVFETFIDREAFEAHQDRTKASDWGAVTRNVRRLYQKLEH